MIECVLGSIIQELINWEGTDKPLGFAGIVTAVAAWTIWGSDLFPAEKDPVGGAIIRSFNFILQLILSRSINVGGLRIETLA